MKFRKAYLILPKITAYTYKEKKWKERLESKAKQWVLHVGDLGVNLYCFMEDNLAYELLEKETGVSWVSVLGAADCNFICKYLHSLSAKYNSVKSTRVGGDFIHQASKKFKPPTNTQDELDYAKARTTVLHNRIRYTVNEILKTSPFVIYLDAANNYCSLPPLQLGDGRMIIRDEIISGVTTYSFGGIPLSEKDYKKVVRRGYNDTNI